MAPIPRIVLTDDANISQYIDHYDDYFGHSKGATSSNDQEPTIHISRCLSSTRDSLELIRSDDYMEKKFARKWGEKLKKLLEEDSRLWRKAYVVYVEWRCRRNCRKLANREDW